MSKINILPAKVYNRIAAGEVVDRPYSVVKELVENAIDAGATQIEIYVENGGKQMIRVVDNGSGIERDDLHSAFLPHATSKISKAEDLEKILTLGFRGEAVASIASVSKMTITSKTADGGCYQLTSDGGQLGEILPAAGENGTDVKVEMLFFNTPVRLQFLKSDKAEETDITTFVSRFILCRSDIAFTYYVNGKKVLQSFGGGDEEALVSVYGAGILKDLYRIDAVKHGIRIRGYIGNQNFSKPNKSYQSVFLNGRYIVNATLSAALSGAYASYLMKRQYPFYVLYIDVPTEIVDVNVHPNKSDVRFSDNKIIYGCVYSVISSVLDGNSKALEYVVEAPKTVETVAPPTPTPSVSPASSAPQKETKTGYRSSVLSGPVKQPAVPPVREREKFSYQDALDELAKGAPPKWVEKGVPVIEVPFVDVEPAKAEVKRRNMNVIVKPRTIAITTEKRYGNLKCIATDYREEGSKPRKPGKYDAEILHKQFPDLYFKRNRLYVEQGETGEQKKKEAQKPEEVDVFEENKRLLMEMEGKKKQSRIEVESCRFVGKLFNTYLLYERKDDVFVIDQHAAHERLIFDRLKEKMETREILQQPMLVPFTLDLNAFESAFIRERMEDIRAMGFDMEEFGENSFKVSAVPLDMQGINLSTFFNDILGDISGFRGIKLGELLKDKLAMAACKAAVKGGMDLSQEEIDKLFEMMDGNMGLKCPHGRPVVAKMTKTELEKMFKRIV